MQFEINPATFKDFPPLDPVNQKLCSIFIPSEGPQQAEADLAPCQMSFLGNMVDSLLKCYTQEQESEKPVQGERKNSGSSCLDHSCSQTTKDSKSVKKSGKPKNSKKVAPVNQKALSSQLSDDISFSQQVVMNSSAQTVNWKRISKVQNSTIKACKQRWSSIKKRQLKFLESLDMSIPSRQETPSPDVSQDQNSSSEVFESLDKMVEEFKANPINSAPILLPSIGSAENLQPKNEQMPVTQCSNCGGFGNFFEQESGLSSLDDDMNPLNVDKFLI